MQLSDRAASIVPFGADQTLFVVVDRKGGKAGAVCEAEIERSDFESIICDLLSGQFGDPVRVIAFNTLEHWSEDVSAEVAREIQARSDIDGEGLPEHLQDFVNEHRLAPSRFSPNRNRGSDLNFLTRFPCANPCISGSKAL
jgi:hypothetical protein